MIQRAIYLIGLIQIVMRGIFRKRKRVFISSTSVDLAEWRAGVADVLVKMGLEVIRMEDFPAIGKSAGLGSA